MTPRDIAIIVAGVLIADIIEFLIWYVYMKFISTSGTDEV